MKLINNFSLRTKFLIIVIPLLAGLLYFSILETTESLEQQRSMKQLDDAVSVSTRISYLVHEIQKERGNSSGFLSNKGQKFGFQLREQRKLTDKRIAELNAVLAAPEYTQVIEGNKELFNGFTAEVKRIPTIRGIVDRLEYTPNEAIDDYTLINTFGLNMLNQIIPQTNVKGTSDQALAYINFLKSKERAGIERAIGTQGFSLQNLSNEVYKRFTSLVAQQDAFMDAFQTSASEDAKEFYLKTVQGEGVDEVDRMRLILFENDNPNEDPSYWFDQITIKINKLKDVEDYLTNKIQSSSQDLAASARQQAIILVSTIIVLSVLVIALVIVVLFNLLRNLKLLGDFTTQIAAGNYEGSVDINSKDELGKFGSTMNTMSSSIQQASQQLRREKMKAQYMFKNTYRTSQVVFAHVNQGIFLINRQFEISKLYSKAIEQIFGVENVAGMKFTEFINPRLVPRDRQALEMFTKHLFNEKVKDKVLGRLNPVETVQIFEESNGDKMIDAKYIRISFTRIWDKDKIRDVMVTVLDETKEVLLKKQIEANKEKNKQETEQLLSIMNMDPVALKNYLDRANDVIIEINSRYENFKGSDYKELAKYTFNQIHNLKGNATLIEMELLEDKFHEIEDSLVKVRGNQIVGDDFIKILYQLKEVQNTILEMSRMLRKIANIYYKTNSEEEIYSNDKLFDSFNKVVKRLNRSLDKETNLEVTNEKNILIPERLKMPVNDIVVQLLRNSLVHGIEIPKDRRNNGKEIEGNLAITLDAKTDDSFTLRYEDDGIGLNKQEIIDKAIKLNLILESDADNMSDKEVFHLIFEDGFSTQNVVSTNAGRGQGMSLIKQIIEKHEATFEVSSEFGKRFELEITFPVQNEIILTEI